MGKCEKCGRITDELFDVTLPEETLWMCRICADEENPKYARKPGNHKIIPR